MDKCIVSTGFFRLGIDFYIGLPRDQLHRVARMTTPGFWDLVYRLDDHLFVFFLIVSQFIQKKPLMAKIESNPTWSDMTGGVSDDCIGYKLWGLHS